MKLRTRTSQQGPSLTSDSPSGTPSDTPRRRSPVAGTNDQALPASTPSPSNPAATASTASPSRPAAEAATGAERASALVQARGLHKTFVNTPVLDGVDFTMDSGDITVIIGRSGSGKSTLLRVLAGLTEPDDGDVHLEGQHVIAGGDKTEAWNTGQAMVGMVFQSYTLWPHMNVLENLCLAPRKILRASKVDSEQRAHEALREVGMESFIRARPAQLSGGQRQRVAIARALMMKPRLLLCDEITSALDPPVAAEVLGVLSRLKQEEGIAVALVTHDMAFASKAADRVVFFSNGKISVDATPEEAFHHCEDPELRSFVEAVRLD